MVLGPERLRTINLSVEDSTDFKHLSPAEGKKHQSLYSTHPLPHPKTWGNNGEPRARLQGEIQRGCETKALEGTNHNKEFNREKGVGNCKRKRGKKKKGEGGGWKQRKFLATSCCAWPFSISFSHSRSAGLPRGAKAAVPQTPEMGAGGTPATAPSLETTSALLCRQGQLGEGPCWLRWHWEQHREAIAAGHPRCHHDFSVLPRREEAAEAERMEEVCNVVTGSMRTGISPLSQQIFKAHTPKFCQIIDQPHPLVLSHPFHCTLLSNNNSLSCPAVA